MICSRYSKLYVIVSTETHQRDIPADVLLEEGRG
jgi:hypothetical protein